jgi:glycosyltransferase involved in cell wall biosynthesis
VDATLPVTAIIPAFNRAELVQRALASVKAQTCPPREVIVVDDASTDATAEAARRLGARVLRHESNRGAAAARNTGVAAAEQPWLALLDSDDEWLPHHLETLWALRGDHVLAAGTAIQPGRDGQKNRIFGPAFRRTALLRSPAALVWPDNFIPASGVLLRTDIVRDAGGFDASLRYAEDLDLWLRVLDRGTGVATCRIVNRWHAHAGQKSLAAGPALTAHRQIVEKYQGRPWWSQRLLERRLGTQDWDVLRLDLRHGETVRALRRAARVARSPQRLVGIAGLLVVRFGRRRRARRVDLDGARAQPERRSIFTSWSRSQGNDFIS